MIKIIFSIFFTIGSFFGSVYQPKPQPKAYIVRTIEGDVLEKRIASNPPKMLKKYELADAFVERNPKTNQMTYYYTVY